MDSGVYRLATQRGQTSLFEEVNVLHGLLSAFSGLF
jgi:hypothetical protein